MENVLLATNLVNTSSMACMAKNKSEIKGSGQWSQAKFSYFLSQLQN
jgi:hypothetical protein